MFGFVNTRQSCYADTVLVCMLLPTHAFDHLWEHPRTTVAGYLQAEADRLRAQQSHSWACTELRNSMGFPWNTSSTQSAVDFFHALLDMCGVSHLGYQTEHVYRIPREPKRFEVERSEGQGFRVHLAVAGMHRSLLDVFETVEHIGEPTSEFKIVKTVVTVTQAPMLVFEVGRNDSENLIHYGYSDISMEVTMKLWYEVYTLVGMVCRKQAHYVAFVWKDSKWWFYDDVVPGENIVVCEHPELTPYKPSRYGELFFYRRTLL